MKQYIVTYKIGRTQDHKEFTRLSLVESFIRVIKRYDSFVFVTVTERTLRHIKSIGA